MKAYEKICSADKFTQGQYARNANGEPCRSSSDKAVCWCTLGAMTVCYEENLEYFTQRGRIELRVGMPVPEWNDTHTYEQVIAVLKELDI